MSSTDESAAPRAAASIAAPSRRVDTLAAAAAGPRRKRVDDLATLRALAHPLRMQLLGALRRDGPATASELGRRLGESSGSASYHLRQLARYGFVEEAPEQPSRRERVWRSVHELTAWDVDAFLDDPAGRAVVDILERERLHGQVDALQRWYAARAAWPLPWVRAAQDSDAVLWLSAAELTELSRELWAVVERRLAAGEGAAGGDDRTPVRVFVQAFPDAGPEAEPGPHAEPDPDSTPRAGQDRTRIEVP